MRKVYTDRSNCARAAKKALMALGEANPKAGAHFEVFEEDGGFCWQDVRPYAGMNVEPAQPVIDRAESLALRADIAAEAEEAEPASPFDPAAEADASIMRNPAYCEAMAEVPVTDEEGQIVAYEPGPAMDSPEVLALYEAAREAQMPNATCPEAVVAQQGPESAPQGAMAGAAGTVAPPEAKAQESAPQGLVGGFDEAEPAAKALPPAAYGLVGDLEALIMGLADAKRAAVEAGRPPRKPAGMLAGLQQEIAGGVWPLTVPLVQSMANAHVQTHINKLFASANAGDRKGVADYKIGGTNSYAKMLRRLQELLLAAIDSRKPEEPSTPATVAA